MNTGCILKQKKKPDNDTNMRAYCLTSTHLEKHWSDIQSSSRGHVNWSYVLEKSTVPVRSRRITISTKFRRLIRYTNWMSLFGFLTALKVIKHWNELLCNEPIHFIISAFYWMWAYAWTVRCKHNYWLDQGFITVSLYKHIIERRYPIVLTGARGLEFALFRWCKVL